MVTLWLTSEHRFAVKGVHKSIQEKGRELWQNTEWPLVQTGDNFYIRWSVEGKVFSKALRDADGSPITTRREADEARQKFIAPFVVADEAAALESIAGKLEGRKAELAKLQDEQNPPLPIGQAWTAFLASPNRPDSGEGTLYHTSVSSPRLWGG